MFDSTFHVLLRKAVLVRHFQSIFKTKITHETYLWLLSLFEGVGIQECQKGFSERPSVGEYRLSRAQRGKRF